MGRRLLLASPVLAAFAFASCSEFNDSPQPADGGTDAATNDATTEDAANDAGEPPCLNASCGVDIATGQANADEVLVDDTRVYWTIFADPGSIRASELADASAVRQVTIDLERPRGVFGFGSFFHFGSGNDVKHIERGAKNGGPSLTMQAGGLVTSTARAGGRVFATAGSAVLWCFLAGGNNNCDNTVADAEQTVGAGARALTSDPSGTRLWLATDESLWKTDPAVPGWVETWKVDKIRAIAADETSVYVARDGQSGITKFGKDDANDAQPTILAPGAPPAWGIAEDGGFVFFTSLEGNVVVKVAKNGTGAKVLAAGLSAPKGIAVRLDKVYVALGDGRIVALPH